jgi:predicted ATP-grasp superfamily ATP-dependent carboligase
MDADIILVGGSVRAAAASARRAGLKPWCVDFFGDLDTAVMSAGGPSRTISRFSELRSRLLAAPQVPWTYTGCLENHSKLVAELAVVRALWGNDRNALRPCRSPARIAHLLRMAGLPVLEIRSAEENRPADRAWVCKPVRSCGGLGVRLIRPGESLPRHRGLYLQEYAAGTPMSAVFARVKSEVRLLGMTEQLVAPEGIDWLNAPPFVYAGSIGPIRPTDGLRREVLRIGEVIGDGCRLRGLFGVDFVCRDGRPWVLEVNPRYTASTEVLERALGIRAFEVHRAEFDTHAPAPGTTTAGPDWVVKAVLYAPVQMRIDYPAGFLANALGQEPPSFADLSPAGTCVPPGRPIMTVFAEGSTRAACVASVQRRSADVMSILGYPARRSGAGPESQISPNGSG